MIFLDSIGGKLMPSPKQAIHIQFHWHGFIINAAGEAIGRNHGEVDAAYGVSACFYPILIAEKLTLASLEIPTKVIRK